jgi:hypothetical protein
VVGVNPNYFELDVFLREKVAVTQIFLNFGPLRVDDFGHAERAENIELIHLGISIMRNSSSYKIQER